MAAIRQAAVMKRARELAARPNVGPIDLAEAIWRAEQLRPGRLRQIAEECGLGRRKAYYLRAIWARFADLDVPRALLAEIGWTKLALIAKRAAAGEERSALEMAQDATVRELDALLRGGAHDRPKAHSIVLRLSPSQHKVVVATLAKFGAHAPRRGKGLAGKERALIKAFRSLRDSDPRHEPPLRAAPATS